MPQAAWWLLGGVGGLIAEALIPGVFLLWLGLAALGTGALVAAFGLSFAWQVASYAAFAAIAISIGLKLRARPVASLNTATAGLVGRRATALSFQGTEGRVRLGDSDWPARLAATRPAATPAVTPGAVLRVVDVDGTVLVVEDEPDHRSA